MIITTFEQFKNLPHNKGKDTKTVYNAWLLHESKLLMMYDSIQMMFQMQNNNYTDGVFGPNSSTAGGSVAVPNPLPTSRVTYYTPNGSYPQPSLLLGYYTPDYDSLYFPSDTSYYIYVNA